MKVFGLPMFRVFTGIAVALTVCVACDSATNHNLAGDLGHVSATLEGLFRGFATSGTAVAYSAPCPVEGQPFALQLTIRDDTLRCFDEDAVAGCGSADSGVVEGQGRLQVGAVEHIHDPFIVDMFYYGVLVFTVRAQPPPTWPDQSLVVWAGPDGSFSPGGHLDSWVYEATDAGYRCDFVVASRD